MLPACVHVRRVQAVSDRPRIIPAMLAKLMSFLLLGIVRFLTGSQARWYGYPP